MGRVVEVFGRVRGVFPEALIFIEKNKKKCHQGPLHSKPQFF